MNSSLSQELAQSISQLAESADCIGQALTRYSDRHARDLYSDTSDLKKQASEYYLLSAEIAATLPHSEEAVSAISALMLRADRAILPELVQQCDAVLEEYVAFRRQINAFLQENEKLLRADSQAFSISRLHGSVREMKCRTDTFRSCLTVFVPSL